ncbi:hypothetical protein MKW98_000943 [Papaver atlanticum]|uniref:Bifunctional inhibitor/plant lipid transfer protein/seed storage helical domain-containing protein n=1 Tax=Papaver atlanticum TaxID=357466 RepID=A0AAD4SDA6_9MAGN|nr:hypothetical protein MKW98_000943 [Papaver atlanticum]
MMMMMKKNTSYLVTFAAVALFVMMMMSNMSVSRAACVAMELQPCLSAIATSAPPTALCCAKLKQQQSCLCQYVKDPNLGKYVNSPNAKKMVQKCGVAIPKC